MNKYLEKLAAQMEETPEEKQRKLRATQYSTYGSLVGGVGGAAAGAGLTAAVRKNLKYEDIALNKKRRAAHAIHRELDEAISMYPPGHPKIQEAYGKLDTLAAKVPNPKRHVSIRLAHRLLKPGGKIGLGMTIGGSLAGAGILGTAAYGLGKLTAKKKED